LSDESRADAVGDFDRIPRRSERLVRQYTFVSYDFHLSSA
jgi:hypothetical protein